MGTRRAFGTTRKHRSGRWGAEYTHPVSRERVLPGKSFATTAEALRWLAAAEVDLDRGQLLDPRGAKQTFESYATSWLEGRNDLRPKTLERSAERSTPTIDEAVRLAEVVKPEDRLMVLLAAVAGLRRGECFALRRRDLVEIGGVRSVNVNASVVFVKDVAIHQAPKTAAGVRRLTLPAVVAQAIVEHLDA